MERTIKQVSRITGLTERTLRWYDARGVMTPSSRNQAGWRMYGDADMERLQQILFFREMGFALGEIADILDARGFDRREALQRHRESLILKRERIDRLICLLDERMYDIKEGIPMEQENAFSAFDASEIEAHQKKYEQEVRARWGNTDAYRQSQKRVKGYRQEDWMRIQEEAQGLSEAQKTLMDEGIAPYDDRWTDLAERWRAHISRNYYECSMEMLEGLAETYLADERFNSYYEGIRPGLAQVWHDAIKALVARARA